MQNIIIFLLILLIFGIIAVIFMLTRQRPGGDGEKIITMIERLNQLAEQNKELRQCLDTKLAETHQATQESLKHSVDFTQKIHNQSVRQVAEITEKLAKLEETNKQVVGFTDQLQNLEKVLTNSKNRGSLGEATLEFILSNILPPQTYELQYTFKDGSRADAIIKIKDKILPIDSKFSLENYRRILNEFDQDKKKELEKGFKNDLKKRIDETAQYIKPDEGTLDFAFMFIPAEGIYYDLLINEVGAVKVDTGGLIDYAFKQKKVIIVSPTTFAAYLQTVLQGLRALQIEESAKEIRANVEKLTKHLLSYDEFMKKLGVSMTTSVNHYNNAYKEFAKIDKDIMKITEGDHRQSGAGKSIEPLILDKPHTEE